MGIKLKIHDASTDPFDIVMSYRRVQVVQVARIRMTIDRQSCLLRVRHDLATHGRHRVEGQQIHLALSSMNKRRRGVLNEVTDRAMQ